MLAPAGRVPSSTVRVIAMSHPKRGGCPPRCCYARVTPNSSSTIHFEFADTSVSVSAAALNVAVVAADPPDTLVRAKVTAFVLVVLNISMTMI